MSINENPTGAASVTYRDRRGIRFMMAGTVIALAGVTWLSAGTGEWALLALLPFLAALNWFVRRPYVTISDTAIVIFDDYWRLSTVTIGDIEAIAERFYWGRLRHMPVLVASDQRIRLPIGSKTFSREVVDEISRHKASIGEPISVVCDSIGRRTLIEPVDWRMFS